MLTFAAAVLLLLSTPGPGVLSAASFGAAFGFRRGLRWVVGLFVGNLAVQIAVFSGVSALILAYPAIRWTLSAAATGYLLYLAWRVATADTRIAFAPTRDDAPGPVGAIGLQLINPKAYAVNSALLSGFAFHPDLAVEIMLKLGIINAIWIPIHLIWLGLGVWLYRLDLSATAHRRVNLTMAVAMVGVVALALVATVRGA